jgi:hypothetical protein
MVQRVKKLSGGCFGERHPTKSAELALPTWLRAPVTSRHKNFGIVIINVSVVWPRKLKKQLPSQLEPTIIADEPHHIYDASVLIRDKHPRSSTLVQSLKLYNSDKKDMVILSLKGYWRLLQRYTYTVYCREQALLVNKLYSCCTALLYTV